VAAAAHNTLHRLEPVKSLELLNHAVERFLHRCEARLITVFAPFHPPLARDVVKTNPFRDRRHGAGVGGFKSVSVRGKRLFSFLDGDSAVQVGSTVVLSTERVRAASMDSAWLTQACW